VLFRSQLCVASPTRSIEKVGDVHVDCRRPVVDEDTAFPNKRRTGSRDGEADSVDLPFQLEN
jgi:hypothetical protein